MRHYIASLLAVLSALGCSGSSGGSDDSGRIRPGTSWQWQLTGEIDTSFDVQMFDIDLFTTPVETIQLLRESGKIVICYLSVGTWEDFRPDANQFPESILGDPLDEFPNERWLDIRQIDTVLGIMNQRLDLAVAKGCDGVEPDNVDAYSNDSGFPITRTQQLAFNRAIAAEASGRGLSVGLKNAVDLAEELEPFFDWALNESCVTFSECDRLSVFPENDKAVFGVEYRLDPDEFCPVTNALNFDFLKKNRDLDAARIACR